jgi:VCBS repeat-containing protein
MKSLRQLLRRPSLSTSASGSSKRRATKRYRSETVRRLSSQALEQRQMLAGDVGESAHNSWNRFDVNQDFQLSPIDALSVINFLSSDSAQAEQVSADVDPFANRKVDVNGDGSVTPSDALSVINALSRGEAMNPLVELLLTARNADDDELTPNSEGVIEVGVGQQNSFFLEVAYNDLRTFGGDIGVFSIFPDIGISRGGLLTPVMREAQQIVIDNDIAQSTSGGITIGMEGSSTTVDISLSELANDARTALSNALVTLGYQTSEFTITEPSFLKGEEQIPNLGFEIRYIAPEFGNVDIPDLTVTETFDNFVETSFREISPIGANGELNYSALSVSLDVRSRTLNDNEELYTSLNRGSFDPATGFSDIGGVGPLVGEGIPAIDDDGRIEEPFDAFRVEVFVNSAISNSNPLLIDVNPGEGVDPLTLYGSDDGVVPDDLIVIDDDAVIAIGTGATSVNTPPVLGVTPLTTIVSENDGSTIFDLLQGASDADGDTLSVANFTFVSGDTSGLTQNGNSLTIDPSAYNSLQADQTAEIVAQYTVTDGQDGSPTQTLTITISGANDAPVVSANISESRSENAAQFSIDLLQNASDPDSVPAADTLDAINIVQNGNDDASGITVDDANNQLIVNPAAYASLESGESVTVTYDFIVSDGNGGTVASTATITINGDTPNRNPVVSGPVTLSRSENDADTTLNLLENASDPDTGDVLSVSGLTLVSGDPAGISVNGSSLSVSPAAYNSLAFDEVATIEYSYNVIDGEGGSVAQTATISIGGANDAPVASGPVTASLSEDDSTDTVVNLLSGASDPDTNDVVTVDAQSLTRVSGDDSGVTGDAGTLTVDPSAYNDLAAGESEVIVYTYDLIDGNGGVTAQSATITITGVNDAPVVSGPVVETFSEDDTSASVDMLSGASDADTNDTLSVANVNTVSGDSSPFTFVNDTIEFDPNAYNSLADGESEEVVLTYDVVDGQGGSTAQTATITINGANDAPVVGNALSFTFNEDQGNQVASLLDGASDPDASDTLGVTGVTVQGDDSGIIRNGSELTIDTSAYGNLNAGQQAVITFTYTVTDGIENVSQTATVTIEGRDEGIPVVAEPITAEFDENDNSTTVDLLQGASDPDGDPLSVIDAVVTSGDARGVTIDANNNRLVVNPSAYADLDDGQQAVVVVTYKITDDDGNTVDQTATVTVNGQTIVTSSISGQLYIDHIENIDEVIKGADPVRNDIKEDDEEGLGSVTVHLKQMTESGEEVIDSTLTDMDGNYTFDGLLPGTYVVEYMLPDSVRFTGSKRGVVVIGEQGGETKSGPDLDAIGLVGVTQRLDYLVKSYIAAGIFGTGIDSESLSGGTALLSADGTQEMFVAETGFDAKFAEVVLNDARDAALLTIIDMNGVVKTARLSAEEFVVTKDGLGVRFFGDRKIMISTSRRTI